MRFFLCYSSTIRVSQKFPYKSANMTAVDETTVMDWCSCSDGYREKRKERDCP